MIEIDSPLTLSRRRGLGKVSICNKPLEAMLHDSSEGTALPGPGRILLPSQKRVGGGKGPEMLEVVEVAPTR